MFDITFIILVNTLRPDLLRDPRSGEQIFTRLQFAKPCRFLSSFPLVFSPIREEDIGQLVLYRDYYMAGWALKEVSSIFSNIFIQHCQTGNSRRRKVITPHFRPRKRRAADAYHGCDEGSW